MEKHGRPNTVVAKKTIIRLIFSCLLFKMTGKVHNRSVILKGQVILLFSFENVEQLQELKRRINTP